MSLQDAIPRCDGSYYAAKQIEFEYPMDLWLILENKYAEKAYLDDVHIVVNMIFQDIADELKEGLLSYLPYSIVFCAKLGGSCIVAWALTVCGKIPSGFSGIRV